MLEYIRFGARVTTRNGSGTSEWLFLGWNEDKTSAWLARPQEPGFEKRGANLMLMSKERIVSFENIEYQKRAEERMMLHPAGGPPHKENQTCSIEGCRPV